MKQNTATGKSTAKILPVAARDFFAENRDKILAFGEYFLEKLADKELLDALAQKDLEKLARIFKLMLDKSFTGEEKSAGEQSKVLEEILSIFKEDRLIE